MGPNATEIVRAALAGSGVDLVASCGVAAFDAVAPEGFRSSSLWPGARGLVVVGSAGPTLWRRLRVHMSERPAGWDEPHPLDRFVGSILARADAALAAAGVAYRRFEPTVDAEPRMHFAAMGRLVGLGSPGPFGMLIHPEHGPWWALRGAWLVRADVDEPPAHREPCAGCAAPCVGGWQNACDVGLATAEARARCVVGQGSRYDPDQIAYHHDHASALARLRRR